MKYLTNLACLFVHRQLTICLKFFYLNIFAKYFMYLTLRLWIKQKHPNDEYSVLKR